MNNISKIQSINYSRVGYSFENIIGVVYVFFGIVIICTSLVVGNSYAFSALVLFLSLFVTVVFRKYPLPWIFLVSILAANPINWSVAFPSSLIFAFCLILFNVMSLFELPRWLYIPAFLSIICFVISSGNWMSGILSIFQQTNYFINYLMMPFILLPVIYLRMAEEKDNYLKLKGLIYYLIIPSTLVLFLAYMFGHPIKYYTAEVTNHVIYKFLNTEVNFTRTQSGFIFASLICASIAIIMLRTKFINRLLAAICMSVNVFLLLSTGSVGSIIACLFGIGAMFFCASRRISIIKYVTLIVAIVCMLLSIWAIYPSKIKDNIELRYKERFIFKGINVDDRIAIWRRAFNYSLKHPEGVGWSLFFVDKTKINTHNDYLLYAINYGIIVGIVYAYMILKLLIFFYRKSKALNQDNHALSIHLSGLGVTTVLLINSISDHLVANKWYFIVIWSILWYAYFCSSTNFKFNNRNSHPKGLL